MVKLTTLMVLVVTASGCTDPVIELSFRTPDASRGGDFDMSCVTAVDVYTNGTAVGDYEYDCVDLDVGPATLAGLSAKLAGTINVQLPASPLRSIEIQGRRGSCLDDDFLPPGELLFYAGAPYIGANEVVLSFDATASCEQAPMTIRPIDILALTTGPTKGDCAAAGAIEGANAGGDIGTLSTSVDGYVMYFASLAGGPLRDGIVAMPAAPTTVGPTACLAASAGDDRFGSLSCIDRDRPSACALPGELEVAGIDGGIARQSIDQAKKNKFPGLVFSAVLDGNRQPIAGASVEIDPKFGEIVYVEPDNGRLTPTGGTATGPSGLFIAYTNAVTTVRVTGNGRSRTTMVGAVSDSPSAAIIMLR